MNFYVLNKLQAESATGAMHIRGSDYLNKIETTTSNLMHGDRLFITTSHSFKMTIGVFKTNLFASARKIEATMFFSNTKDQIKITKPVYKYYI